MIMKAKTLLFVFVILLVPALNAQNSGLILPMPGQIFDQPKQADKESQNNKPHRYSNSESSATTDEKPKGMIIPNKSIDSKKVFIPLPASGQRSKPQPPRFPSQPEKMKMQSDPNALIQLPSNTGSNDSESEESQPSQISVPTDIPTAHQAKAVDDIPLDPSQIKVQNNNAPGIEPPMITTEAPQVVTTETEGTVTVFPKDTSSAIFMVMKSWQCEDYDATTLLDHAVGVYSQDSEDKFQILGLPTEENAYTVSIEEEDITLDELLDIVTQKAGCDWGVDIENKTIHFYSASINSSSNSSTDLW